MTDANFSAGDSLAQNSSFSNQPEVQSSFQSQNPAQTSPSTQERLFKQDEVNEIVGRAKQEAIERHERRAQSQQQQQPYNQAAAFDQKYLDQLVEQKVSQIRQDAWQQHQDTMQKEREAMQKQQAEQLVGTYLQKLQNGHEKYADFESKVADLDLSKFPNSVLLMSNIENAADLTYHFADNPEKAVLFEQLYQMNPRMASARMTRLSEELKSNETASGFVRPREPLSQLKPTNSGAVSGKMTIADYKKMF